MTARTTVRAGCHPAVMTIAVGLAAGGCARAAPAGRSPAPALSVLLQRGAIASASMTLGPGRDGGGDRLPDALRDRAARRYPLRALAAGERRDLSFARLSAGGPPVAVAIGDFSAPLVVLDDPAGGQAPEVLLEGGNLRLVVRLPRQRLREVTTGPVELAASPRAAGAAIRLGAGLAVERLGAAAAGDSIWVRYRDGEAQAVGLLDPARLGRVYLPAPAALPSAGDARLATPLVLLDEPGGAPLATVWRSAGPEVPARRLRTAHGHTLVTIDLARDASLTGWVSTAEVERRMTTVRERRPPPAPGQWLSIAGLPGRDLLCVELPAGTRLRERARGAVSGLVTRTDRFILLAGPRGGWLEVGAGHPFGLARLWAPARGLRAEPCDPPGQPGSS